MNIKHIVLGLIFLVSGNIIHAQITQWRGPNRDGVFNDTMLAKSWTEDGPDLILKFEGIGKGWSSVIYDDGVYYATGMIDTFDYLSAVSENGTLLWQAPFGRSWVKSFPDTRSSPTKEGNRIYVQSGMGKVSCFNSNDGSELWTFEADKVFETDYHLWGNSETPLIVDDKVICNPAGKIASAIALNKYTGELIWKSEPTGYERTARAYASSNIYEWNNHRFILALNTTHIIALYPETGEIAWQYQYYQEDEWYDQPGIILTNTPTCVDNHIFITMGYDYKAVMLEMDSTGTSVSEKFVDHTFDNHHHGVIYHDGFLYGSNWKSNNRGKWVCMNWKTGEINYVTNWENKGSIIQADGMFYCYNEKGNVGLVKPDTDKFDVISEFKINEGSGPHWAHPFIKDGKLIIRHGEIFMVYDIKKHV